MIFVQAFAFVLSTLDPNSKIAEAVVKKIEPTEISDTLIFPARVESKTHAIVASEGDGVLAKVFRHLGDQVKKGEPLFSIRNTDPVYEYREMNILSPVGGVLSSVSVTKGTYVQRTQTLAQIEDPKNLQLLIEVPAHDLWQIKKGQVADVKLSQSNISMKAEVQGVSDFVDSATGTATAILNPQKSDQKSDELDLRPGELGKVIFKLNSKSALMVPETSLTYNTNSTAQDKASLLLVDKGTVVEVPVQIGQRREGNVEILSGLKAGDLLLERSSRYVSKGEKVKVLNEE